MLSDLGWSQRRRVRYISDGLSTNHSTVGALSSPPHPTNKEEKISTTESLALKPVSFDKYMGCSVLDLFMPIFSLKNGDFAKPTQLKMQESPTFDVG